MIDPGRAGENEDTAGGVIAGWEASGGLHRLAELAARLGLSAAPELAAAGRARAAMLAGPPPAPVSADATHRIQEALPDYAAPAEPPARHAARGAPAPSDLWALASALKHAAAAMLAFGDEPSAAFALGAALGIADQLRLSPPTLAYEEERRLERLRRRTDLQRDVERGRAAPVGEAIAHLRPFATRAADPDAFLPAVRSLYPGLDLAAARMVALRANGVSREVAIRTLGLENRRVERVMTAIYQATGERDLTDIVVKVRDHALLLRAAGRSTA